MADNDKNDDEYKFAELDSLGNETMGDNEPGSNGSMSSGQGSFSGKKDIKRNALIVVGFIICALVMYKFIGFIFLKKPTSVKPTTAPITQEAPKSAQAEITPAPIEQIKPVVQQIDTELKQKISAVEIAQQSLRSDVNSLSDQVGNVNSTINNLNTQMTKFTQLIGDLSNQVSKQSEEIQLLRIRTQPKVIKPVVKQNIQHINYTIQAVIPGRAWLIGSNGSTLTIREGTKIAGYGVVKLIDSMQGRVLTSLGQVIKFSQEDS